MRTHAREYMHARNFIDFATKSAVQFCATRTNRCVFLVQRILLYTHGAGHTRNVIVQKSAEQKADRHDCAFSFSTFG